MAVAFSSFASPLRPAASPVDGAAELRTTPRGVALFPILVRRRWGFIDRSGQVVVPPEFEGVGSTESERASASATGRGEPDDVFMDPARGPETTAVVAVESRGRWGFVDRRGQLLAPRFDEVGAFREGMAPVRQGALWGFVSDLGSLVVPPRFDAVSAFLGGLAIVNQDSRYGVIDAAGRFVAKPRFESIRSADSVFNDNRALFTLFGKKGYLARAGTIAVQPMFDDALPFSEGLAPVTRGSQAGYIDTTGRMVIAPRDWTAERFHRGRAVVLVNGKYGYIDRSGAYLAEPQFSEAGAFTSDDQAVAWKGPARGLVDLSGRWSESPIDELQRLDDSLSVAVVAGRKGLVRRATGEMLREYPWEELGPFSEGIAHVRASDGRLGFIDLDGRLVIPPRFRRVGRFDGGLCKAAARDTLGYVDRSGAWIWSSRFR